jgi:hypothetical protein
LRVIEKLAARTDYLENSSRRSIIGEDFKFPCTDWNGNAECRIESQVFVSRLVGDNEYTQVVDIPTLQYALLDVYLVRPESSFISCSIVQGIRDHFMVLLEEEGKKITVDSSRKSSLDVP